MLRVGFSRDVVVVRGVGWGGRAKKNVDNTLKSYGNRPRTTDGAEKLKNAFMKSR